MGVSHVSLPDATTRWRCAGCGNLTRFDVTRQTRRQEFWHVGLSGEPRVEEAATLAEELIEVSCRWCGRSDAIELVARPDDSTARPDHSTARPDHSTSSRAESSDGES